MAAWTRTYVLQAGAQGPCWVRDKMVDDEGEALTGRSRGSSKAEGVGLVLNQESASESYLQL